MSRKGAWSGEEESLLRENYPSMSAKALSDMLERSVSSIEGKAKRLGLSKLNDRQGDGDAPDGYLNPFEMMTRDDALKLDKIDLLRINWSLFEMYRRELNNPSLTKAERHRLMNALSNHTSTINSVMRGSEDQLGDEDDLKTRFIKLNLGDGQSELKARRVRITLEGVEDEAE
jgi:hypothetical protein